jgi:hypothetical protein
MTKRYSILRKKLQEVESELRHVFSLPVTTPCSELLLEEIHQKFVFAKNLLSAEVASHPSKPHHLQHLEQRLTELERDFQEWVNFKASAFDHVEDDNASRCSCTESCLNDDGEASSDLGSPVYEGLIGEKALVGFSGGFNLNQENSMPAGCLHCFVEEKAEEETVRAKHEQRRVGIASLCRAMAIGAVLGVAFMGYVMARISGCFHYAEPRSFPTPT